MNPWWNSLGLLAAVASAVALYAASPHCGWSTLRRQATGVRAVGVLLAVVSLVVWIAALGPAVGVCAMLGTWMLAMVALPWLALATGAAGDDASGDA